MLKQEAQPKFLHLAPAKVALPILRATTLLSGGSSEGTVGPAPTNNGGNVGGAAASSSAKNPLANNDDPHVVSNNDVVSTKNLSQISLPIELHLRARLSKLRQSTLPDEREKIKWLETSKTHQQSLVDTLPPQLPAAEKNDYAEFQRLSRELENATTVLGKNEADLVVARKELEAVEKQVEEIESSLRFWAEKKGYDKELRGHLSSHAVAYWRFAEEFFGDGEGPPEENRGNTSSNGGGPDLVLELTCGGGGNKSVVGGDSKTCEDSDSAASGAAGSSHTFFIKVTPSPRTVFPHRENYL